MLQEIQKQIIRYALDLDISSVNTYSGYKGDLIVKIVTKNRQTMSDIRKFALSTEIKEVVIKEKSDMGQYEVFCVTQDEGVYTLR